MKIVWDELKRQANLAKHGLDLASIDVDFFLRARIADARGGRYQAIGRLRGRVVVLIFSRLGREAYSLISLRPASLSERREI